MACNAVATARVKAARLNVEQVRAALSAKWQIENFIPQAVYHGGTKSPYVGFVTREHSVFYNAETGEVIVQVPGGFQRETDVLAEEVRSLINNRAKLLIAAALGQVATITNGQAAGNATILTIKV